MVAAGEATVEQIDLSITDGPGLRWPVQGPMLTFHLAGGQGGMAHMLDHFGPSLQSPVDPARWRPSSPPSCATPWSPAASARRTAARSTTWSPSGTAA